MNIATPELLSRGRSAEVYSWRDNKVLKLFHDSCSPDWVDSEAEITDCLFKAGLPVPQVFETIELDNRKGIVFEKINGISMLDACLENPQHAGIYGRLLASIHHEIHNRAIEALPDLVPSLAQSVRKSTDLTVEQKQMVLNFLESQASGYQLCHMDFHPDQVLITENGPCVIDWETARHGNPLADVARTALILRIGVIPRPTSITSQDIEKIRISLLSTYLDQYSINSSRASTQSMDIWELVSAIVRLSEKIDGEEQQLKLIIEKKIEACDEIDFP